ncbi:MAG TPA: FKBP-type peptidyl-prolyl cis-trans isomerase [Lacisediminihabitans sp.]|uniref:FKBP-type peptidyl-prolyl cis-trans isomerase n=1 Tax=Lacisediminihabitans sp. TaxID=2787631 RepID=UPI002EDB2B26
MRKTTALIAALAVLAGLTACADGTTAAGCNPLVSSGSASSVVTATGKFGVAPKVTIPTPLYTKKTEKSVIIAGKGAAVQNGQPVVVDVTILNATNSTVLQTTDYSKGGGSLLTVGSSSFPAVSDGLQCATVGSRIAVVGSPKDSHSGQADPTNGIAKNDSFVYVIDVKSAFPARADGSNRVPQSGFPAVVLAPNGAPGITLPDETAPKTLKAEVLKQGDGKTVKNGDYLVVKYTGVGWTDKTVFDSTWKTDEASVIQVGSTSVVPGLSKELIGQKAGSQVLIVVPPKEATVADGSGTAPAGETLVYVVDVLGVVQ